MRLRTILIGNEDDLWIRSCSAYFHAAGYMTESARTVSELIRKARNGAGQVVLLDEEMEGVKACDLVPILKGIDDSVQIIVTSSEQSLGFVKRLRGSGIFYQAMKPVDMEELKSAVDCAFQKIERENPVKEGFLTLLVPGRAPA